MSDFDEMRRLRDADPIKGSEIPSADGPAQRALRERIVMSEQRAPWLRTRVGGLSAAAAVVLLVAGGIGLAMRGGEEPPPQPGPITPGTASCVEMYSLVALENRAVAFDGTVRSVSGDEITFTVGEWFKGGDGETVTLKGASTLGGITSAGPGISLEPGARLLVAGDGGFAWGCGFTQPYEQDTAAAWRAALS